MLEERVLGNLLVRQGLVAPDALEPLLLQQREKGTSLGELLVQSKLASEVDLARALAAECRVTFSERVDSDAVQAPLAARVPIGYAKNHLILVMEERDDVIDVVCADPLAIDGIDGLFIGPSDLSAAMGFMGQPNHPEVQAAMSRVLASASKLRFCFFMRLVALDCCFPRRACRLGSQTADRISIYAGDSSGMLPPPKH